MKKGKAFVYTGCENLEAMAGAKNYNKYLVKFITSAAKDTESKKVKALDFGAGSGTYAEMVRDQGIDVDCLEPDKKLQKILNKKGFKAIDNIDNLKPEIYDVIYALNVMEHVKNDAEAIAKLRNALKPGGRLVVYVPAFQVLYSAMDERVGHYRRYRKERLRLAAREADLSIQQLRYCDPIGFAAALTFKGVGNKDGVISSGSVRFYDRLIFPISRVLEVATGHMFGKNVVLVAKR